MRRARFPIELDEAESVPGAIARSIRLNVLERSSVAFEGAAIARRGAGAAQFLPAADMVRLADFLGCDADRLVRQAGTKAEEVVQFGEMVLPSGDLEFERRRIAPVTLRTQPFHHTAWMLRLLPYCTVSLERLVDACPRCDVALGWRRCWGIGICEWCREPVPPSCEAPLEAVHADDYRAFADMLSLDPEARQPALQLLPESLRRIDVGTLVQMAIRLGSTCRSEPVKNVRRESVFRMPPALLASVVATGMAMLRGWPASFVRWSTEALAANIDDLPGYHAIRADIRRLGDTRKENDTQAALVRAAMPSEFGSFARSAPTGAFMTGAELRGVAHLRPHQMRLIREGLEDRRLPSVDRQRSQYNPDRSREFGVKYRDSKRLARLTFALMLPTYAIEQMLCMDVLEREDDKLVELARGGACATAGAVDTLRATIEQTRSRTERPRSAVSLHAAARRIGGREKPWGAIFIALRRGRITFWLSDEAISSRTIFVEPASIAVFEQVVFQRDQYSAFPFASTCAKFEAEEILNLPAKNLTAFIDAGHLTFRGEGRGLVTDTDVVIDLARKMVSFAELKAHTGWTYWQACDETAALGVGRIGIGWCRSTLTANRIVPALPGAGTPRVSESKQRGISFGEALRL